MKPPKRPTQYKSLLQLNNSGNHKEARYYGMQVVAEYTEERLAQTRIGGYLRDGRYASLVACVPWSSNPFRGAEMDMLPGYEAEND